MFKLKWINDLELKVLSRAPVDEGLSTYDIEYRNPPRLSFVERNEIKQTLAFNMFGFVEDGKETHKAKEDFIRAIKSELYGEIREELIKIHLEMYKINAIGIDKPMEKIMTLIKRIE